MRTKAIMEPAPHLSGVYFDDYKVTYTPTNIVQYNEYYPYGLQTATSWTRENATQNNFLGNGGTELNTTTSLYDLEYRNYDPALARMHQVDPMADKYASYTPYNYSFNAPSNFNDVNGADPNPGEPDHVTRRGYQVLMANFDTAFPSGGGSGTLFDNIWGAVGFNNIGGIQNAGPNTAAADRYTDAQAVKDGVMNVNEYAQKYGGSLNFWSVYDMHDNNYLYLDKSFYNLPGYQAAYMNGQDEEYKNNQQSSSSLPGWLTYVPVVGSSIDAYNDFKNGNYVWATINVALAVSDVFMIKSLLTIPAKVIAKNGIKGLSGLFGVGGNFKSFTWEATSLGGRNLELKSLLGDQKITGALLKNS